MLNNSFRFIKLKYFQTLKFSSLNETISNAVIPRASFVHHPYDLPPFDTNNDNSQVIGDKKFAVVAYSGRQYKVTEGDTIIVDKISDKDIGEKIDFEKVLLVGSKYSTYVGRPLVPDVKVSAIVEQKLKDEKVIIFKKRRRKHSQSIKGFRREIAILRIGSIEHSQPSL
mmetsp:Transcript_18296/g.19060  ORF Transcript_18296/g.19060 Transcript_18296/m.19060 type:complete len:169 (+) Transcript_18296:31-537(+)